MIFILVESSIIPTLIPRKEYSSQVNIKIFNDPCFFLNNINILEVGESLITEKDSAIILMSVAVLDMGGGSCLQN